MLTTLFLDRPSDATFERDFGAGYYRKTLHAEGLDVEQTVYAPFGDGSRAMPAAVMADHLDDGLAPASVAGTPSGTLFAFRAPLTLAPGARTTLRYAFGMAHGDQIAALVAKYRAAADPLAASAVMQGAVGPGDAGGGRTAAGIGRHGIDPFSSVRAVSRPRSR